MPADMNLIFLALVAFSGFALVLLLLTARQKGRLENRLEGLSDQGDSTPEVDNVAKLARKALPKMGAALLPQDEEKRSRLQARLMHAGFYQRQAMLFFLGVKMALMVGPPALGLAAGLLGLVDLSTGFICGVIVGAGGLIGPNFWLDYRKKDRQTSFRRALPDALDLLVICLEGGLSLPGSVRRVAGELRTAHPPLAKELNIVQREVQLGRSPGEAMRHFAERADLEEIRGLASVIVQTERYGASLVKALRVHAETLRIKRLQYAEEMAQKAATKIVFPTILFILPCIFVIILGPALVQITEMLSNLNINPGAAGKP
jgi:tight adherence protein C